MDGGGRRAWIEGGILLTVHAELLENPLSQVSRTLIILTQSTVEIQLLFLGLLKYLSILKYVSLYLNMFKYI